MKIIDAHLHFSNREGFRTTARDIGKVNYSADGLNKEFEQSGIAAGIVMATAMRESGFCHGYPDEFILEDGKPDNLLFCAGVNPVKLKEDKSELLHLEKELGKSKTTGIKIYAGYFSHYVYDPVYDPVYALAESYKVPVVIHCGDTQSGRGLIKYAHPLTVDELAVEHPEITFVISHLGVPWVMDTAEMMLKNKNVYADISGLLSGDSEQILRMKSKRYYADMIRQALEYADRYQKVLFGSDWPLVPIGPYIDFAREIIPAHAHEDVFYNNALAVFPKLKQLL
ncbi:MAG: amidohydrolase family protein [Christensenellales bacterium]